MVASTETGAVTEAGAAGTISTVTVRLLLAPLPPFNCHQGITQVQLAERLGVSQQTITAYEVGRRRIQVSALPVIAQALGVGIEDLVSANAKPAKRGPAPKIQQQLERVSQLPRARQRMVSEVLDSLLAQAR